MSIAYYHQTKLGCISPGPANTVLVSSLHFGYDAGSPYIHLNDWVPDDARYRFLWTRLPLLKRRGVKVLFMMGGAGGAFTDLFENFHTFYGLLSDFLTAHENVIDGLNLDVEENVNLNHFQYLVLKLKQDFPNLELSLAPVVDELLNPTVPGAFSGFAYQDLFDTVGDCFSQVYVQMYAGSFTCKTFEKLVQIFTLDPAMLVPGMLSGDFVGQGAFDVALMNAKQMNQFCKDRGFPFGGVFVWEYSDAPPAGELCPTMWAVEVAKALR